MTSVLFQDGEPWRKRVVHTPAFMRSVGAFVGDVSKALDSFHHPGAERWHLWWRAVQV
jgi:hypothetical protein